MAYQGEVTVSEKQILEYKNSKSLWLSMSNTTRKWNSSFVLIQIFLSKISVFSKNSVVFE